MSWGFVMEYRKALLKAASLLALTAAAGAQSPANASIPSQDNSTMGRVPLASTVPGDPLFELMKRTNGSLAMRSVENALRGLFGELSSVQVQMAPKMLSSLAGLGASPAT